LSEGLNPNDLWCADYKGEFQLADKRYCYPLTVTDHASRFLLLCEALDSTREELAMRAFDRLFRERGLPPQCVPTMAFPLPRRMVCFSSRAFRCGGCGSALPLSESGPDIPSRMAGMSACT
jgi:transposase InsO family protein